MFSEILLVLRRIQRDIAINVLKSLQSTRHLGHVLIKLNFLDSVSKNSQISNWKLSFSIQMDRRTDGRTERHYEANSRLSQLYKRAYLFPKTQYSSSPNTEMRVLN